MASGDDSNPSFEELFRIFAKFGDIKSKGDNITLSNSDKWMKQAKVIDGKKITTTDTGIYFKQTTKAKSVNFKEYQDFLERLAKSKKMEASELQAKLASCGTPGITGTTTTVKSAAVDRLTDTSKYTGSSKKRFDDAGKGKGKEGREDIPDSSGYVKGYKEKGSYDNKH